MCFTPKSGICACAAVVAAIVVIGCSTSPQAKEAKYLKKGEVLMEKKDFPRALLEFRNAARAMRTDAEPQYQIGPGLFWRVETSEPPSALFARPLI